MRTGYRIVLILFAYAILAGLGTIVSEEKREDPDSVPVEVPDKVQVRPDGKPKKPKKPKKKKPKKKKPNVPSSPGVKTKDEGQRGLIVFLICVDANGKQASVADIIEAQNERLCKWETGGKEGKKPVVLNEGDIRKQIGIQQALLARTSHLDETKVLRFLVPLSSCKDYDVVIGHIARIVFDHIQGIVTISAVSCVGKSNLAQRLARLLNEKSDGSAVVHEQDNVGKRNYLSGIEGHLVDGKTVITGRANLGSPYDPMTEVMGVEVKEPTKRSHEEMTDIYHKLVPFVGKKISFTLYPEEKVELICNRTGGVVFRCAAKPVGLPFEIKEICGIEVPHATVVENLSYCPSKLSKTAIPQDFDFENFENGNEFTGVLKKTPYSFEVVFSDDDAKERHITIFFFGSRFKPSVLNDEEKKEE